VFYFIPPFLAPDVMFGDRAVYPSETDISSETSGKILRSSLKVRSRPKYATRAFVRKSQNAIKKIDRERERGRERKKERDSSIRIVDANRYLCGAPISGIRLGHRARAVFNSRPRWSATKPTIELVVSGVENTRLTRRQRGRKKGMKGEERDEREKERQRDRERERERENARWRAERESMGISTKHVTIKGAGGCESSLD